MLHSDCHIDSFFHISSLLCIAKEHSVTLLINVKKRCHFLKIFITVIMPPTSWPYDTYLYIAYHFQVHSCIIAYGLFFMAFFSNDKQVITSYFSLEKVNNRKYAQTIWTVHNPFTEIPHFHEPEQALWAHLGMAVRGGPGSGVTA